MAGTEEQQWLVLGQLGAVFIQLAVELDMEPVKLLKIMAKHPILKTRIKKIKKRKKSKP